MNFSASSLIASFVFGVIGIYVFKEGKKRLNFIWVACSIALMSYTFFTKGILLDWGVGIGLCVLAYCYRE